MTVQRLPIASFVVAADQQACGFVGRPTLRAGALLAAAFFIFAGARAETDSPPGEVAVVAPDGILDRSPVDPAPIPRRAPTESSLRGNPLWAIALEALAVTGARPIFSPSRRPPSLPVVAVTPPPAPKPLPPREPERLKLTLLGTVIGASESIGVFLDETSKDVIRIRAGTSHDGWTLNTIHRRAASFEKNRQETTLVLAHAGSEPPAAGIRAVALSPVGVSAPGNHGAANSAEDRTRPTASVLPISAPMTRNAHKIRQDILSIGAQN